MYMRVESEFLIPGMQNAEEADLGAEVLGIAGDFQKRLRTGAKQEIVEDLLVLQGQWRQLPRKREDHMHIARGEKFSPAAGVPVFPRSGLSFRTVPVTAGIGTVWA